MKLNHKLRKTSVPETVIETAREYVDDKDEDDDEWFDDPISQLLKAESNHDDEKKISR